MNIILFTIPSFFEKKLRLLSIVFILVVCFSCSKEKKAYIPTLNGNRISPPSFNGFVETQMSRYKVPGLAIAILNEGEIVHTETFGVTSLDKNEKINKEAIFEAASLSKPVFAYFVMKQVDKGLIDLDTPLHKYVSYTDIEHDARYKSITPRLVLSHRTGLPNWRKDTLNFTLDPGTQYQYSGEGFQYLARALAKVNNVDRDGLFEIFNEEVATPLGAQRLYFDWNQDVADHKVWGHKNGEVDSNGPSDFRTKEFGSAHNLHTDIMSYARYLSAVMSGKHLSKKIHHEFLKAQVAIPSEDYENAVMGNTHWSLGFGMKKTKNGMRYTHGGNNGAFTAYMVFYPEQKFGMVLFSNSEKVMFSNFTNEIASYLETDVYMNMEALNQILSQYD